MSDDPKGTRHTKQDERVLRECRCELEMTRDKLIRAEKMASLGELVAGIAHEINTPLGALKSNNDLFLRGLTRLTDLIKPGEIQDEGVRQEVLKVLEGMKRVSTINEEAAERIVRIVNSLRRYARAKEEPSAEGDIHEWLDNTLTLVEHEYRNRITVVREYTDLPKITCVAGKLNQVFMNLLVNAGHAIEGQGTVTIRTWCRNGWLVIEFADTGCGIPKENLEKIFEAGFTTKGEGIGTGLGLAIARQIMSEHGGRIEVESTVGSGSTFRLLLPVEAS